MNLYQTTDKYVCHLFNDEDEWKENRVHGIGGSDASSLVGLNKYKSNCDLWREKKGLIKFNISNKATEYGKAAEDPLRILFQLKHPEYDVQYMPCCQLQSKSKSYRTYSPDGLILDKSTGKRGIYEGKTTLIRNKQMYEEWKNQVPENYFIQTLHGLLVTGFEFVVINAELRFDWSRNTEIVEQTFTRQEVLNSLQWLDEQEDKAWRYYEKDIEPPLLLDL